MPTTPAKKLITVFGATGSQGSAVTRSLAQNRAFAIRALTRTPGSPAAKNLAATLPAIELVRADGWNRADLLAAFRGSWGVFVNTNTEDESCNAPHGPTEADLGRLIIDAAATSGVKHLVYSALADCEALTGGIVRCRMMLHKAAVWKHALAHQASGSFLTVTSVDPGWFFEGLLLPDLAPAFGGFPFRTDEEGYLTCRVPRWGPDASWTGVKDDYGDVVHGVFVEPGGWNRKTVQGISEVVDFDGIVGAWNELFPERKARFVEMRSWEEFETGGDRGLEDLRELYHFSEVVGKQSQGVGVGVGDEEWEVETGTALGLKRRAWAAMGRDVEGEGCRLTTAERFLREHFSEGKGAS